MRIPHLEDLPLLEGRKGIVKTFTILNEFVNGHKKVSVKWDGAPAIVAGIHPDSKKFFVGTKAVFHKTKPKICYSVDDIDNYYHEVPDLKNKLTQALLYLPDLNYDGVYQGDFLFYRPSAHAERNFKFQPNTIIYEIDVFDEQMFGFAVHTKYQGLDQKTATPTTAQEFSRSDNIWLVDGEYDSEILDNIDTKIGNSALALILETAKLIDDDFLEELETTSKMSRLFYDVMCDCANNNTFPQFFSVLDEVSEKVIKFQKDRYEQDPIISRIPLENRKNFIKKLEDNSKNIQHLFMFVYGVMTIKQLILRALAENSPYNTYVYKDGKQVPCTPEGYVVDGVKLVDREQFTYNNHLNNKE